VKKTAVIDIDGVLADYYKRLETYFSQELQLDITKIKTNEHNLFELISETFGGYLFTCGIDGFRSSGQLRSIEPFEHAQEFMREVNEQYHTLLLTSRGGQTDCKVREDTEYWLESNKMPYDELLFREHKADHLRYRMGMGNPNISFMVEDNGKTANQVAELGITSYLLNKEYNQIETHPDVIRVNTLKEVLENENK